MTLSHWHDDGGLIPCALCGADAAGPCARCRRPLCGDCCVLTTDSGGQWAICIACAERGGKSLRPAWTRVALWLTAPLLGLTALLVVLNWAFGW